MSTFLPTTPGFFFYFVIAVTILATGIASYLQSSVSAVAALFGPEAMQAMMSGQAAIAVGMSTVQVISILASESFSDAEHSKKTSHDRTVEERSACAFFALSACFLAASAFAHRTLTRMHEYRILVAPMESETMRERQALPMFGQETVKDQIHQILSVAKANIIYEIAVAYVAVVTLVGFSILLIRLSNPNSLTGNLPCRHDFDYALHSRFPGISLHRHPFLGLQRW